LSFFFFCSFCIESSRGDEPPKRWIVNLDATPTERWPWKDMLPFYNQSFHDAVGLIGQFIPEFLQEPIEFLATQLLPYLGDYAGEITSGADSLNISYGQAVLLNLIYEVEAGCTSIIAQDPQGKIYHGRNLDFKLASTLRKLAIDVDFQRGGKTLYRGTTFAGYVGLLTGMRPGAFSISADQRNSGYLFENLLEALFIPGTTAAAFLIRDTLEDVDIYDTAIKQLATVSLAAPAYLIVAGTKPLEGVVITRDREGTRDIWQLDSPSRWFEVETNYDHWDPAGDDRRQIANLGMTALGQSRVSLDGIFDVLSIHDVFLILVQHTQHSCALRQAIIPLL